MSKFGAGRGSDTEGAAARNSRPTPLAAYRSGSQWPLGFYESPETSWNATRETSRWIGKPWRRIELLTNRNFYKGEEVGRNRDLTIHFGWRRFGIGFTLILMKADVLDYSDEEHQ